MALLKVPTSLKQIIAQLYKNEALISRGSVHLGTAREVITEWSTIATIIGCLQAISARELLRTHKTTVVADFVFYCSLTDIRNSDKLTINNVEYEVKSVDRTYQDTLIKVFLQELT